MINFIRFNLIHFMQKNSVHDPTIVITPFVAVDDWTGEVNRQWIETVQRGVGVPEDERRTGTRPHVSAHSREYRITTCWRNQKNILMEFLSWIKWEQNLLWHRSGRRVTSSNARHGWRCTGNPCAIRTFQPFRSSPPVDDEDCVSN